MTLHEKKFMFHFFHQNLITKTNEKFSHFPLANFGKNSYFHIYISENRNSCIHFNFFLVFKGQNNTFFKLKLSILKKFLSYSQYDRGYT